MTSLDISDDEPNITVNVEDLSEDSVESEEEVEKEPEEVEPEVEPDVPAEPEPEPEVVEPEPEDEVVEVEEEEPEVEEESEPEVEEEEPEPEPEPEVEEPEPEPEIEPEPKEDPVSVEEDHESIEERKPVIDGDKVINILNENLNKRIIQLNYLYECCEKWSNDLISSQDFVNLWNNRNLTLDKNINYNSMLENLESIPKLLVNLFIDKEYFKDNNKLNSIYINLNKLSFGNNIENENKINIIEKSILQIIECILIISGWIQKNRYLLINQIKKDTYIFNTEIYN